MDDNDISNRLSGLDRSLSEFGATEPTPWELASLFNVLLEQAKQSHGDDPVVVAIEPAEQAGSGKYATNSCGALRGSLSQLFYVLD
jgi:hypothetical protein